MAPLYNWQVQGAAGASCTNADKPGLGTASRLRPSRLHCSDGQHTNLQLKWLGLPPPLPCWRQAQVKERSNQHEAAIIIVETPPILAP